MSTTPNSSANKTNGKKKIFLIFWTLILVFSYAFSDNTREIIRDGQSVLRQGKYENFRSSDWGTVFYVEGGTLTVNQSIFKNNSSSGDLGRGGAIYNAGTVILNSVEFSTNTAVMSGGAIVNINISTMEIGEDAKFQYNKTGQYGGAIINEGNLIIKSGAIFDNNSSKYGGAICNYQNNVTIYSGAIFRNNFSTESGGAIYNRNMLNLIAENKNIEFTGNMANGVPNAIYDYYGTINLWTEENQSIIFNDGIKSYNEYSTLNINPTISGIKESFGTGIIVLNEDMTGYTGTVNFYGGTVELGEKGKWFGGKVNIDISNATINFANGLVEEHKFNTVKVSGNLNLPIVNADLKNEKMDTISAISFVGSGKIIVDKVKIIKDIIKKEVTIKFADNNLKDKVEFNGNVETLFYKYNATYDDITGAFTFVNEGSSGLVNMATAAGAVASSVGGYAIQTLVAKQTLVCMNMSVSNKKSANINSSNLYVSAGNQIFDDSTTIERSLWLRPFALQETIKLNGVDIDNTLYGTLAGIDLPIGQDKQLSFYLGYAGSKQEFDEVKTNQTGYLVGLTGMLVKEKWYLGATVNGIFNKVSADSEDETNDFDMNMFTVGAKAGYNIDLSDKWILEPNITVMYGIANSDSYETSLGSIDSQSTSNILVEPQVKAKWQLTNGWQPYGLVGYSANLSGKPKVKTEIGELELDSIDGFVEYGIGVNKEFIGSVWSCYGQVTGRSGGRNGFGGNLGIKYKF